MKVEDGTLLNQATFDRLRESTPASYTVWNDDGTYRAESNLEDGQDYVSATAATVIHNAWAAMANGGRIHVKGDINLGTTPIEFTLTKYTKDLILTGEGETGTEFTYTGTGYAITVNTDDVAAGYYSFRLQDFCVMCNSKTAGRSGISIDRVGRIGVLQNVVVQQADIGVDIGTEPNDTNQIYLYDCKVVTCNIGFKTATGSTNEIAFYNCQTRDSATNTFHLEGGTSMLFYGGLSSPSAGGGIYAYETENLAVYGHRFEPSATCDYDVYLTGSTGSYKVRNAIFSGCYFNAGSKIDYGIKLGYVNQLTLQNCRSKNHNIAFLYFAIDHTHSVTLINPDVSDPYLLGSITLTQSLSRMAGIVMEPRRTGLIVLNASGGPLAEGDVVVPAGGGTWTTATTANNNVPSVVMYGQANAQPIVIAVSGVTPVYVDGAVTLNDTIVTQNVAGDATINNAQTDPKKIIGYGVNATGGAGNADVKVL